MRKISLLGFGTAVLVAGALMFSFTLTPVTAAPNKTIICHVDVDDDEEGVGSSVIEVSTNGRSVEKHLDNHLGDFVDETLTPGDQFASDDCDVS